ncbi:response regulator receiver domain protein [Synechococcus sp. PCC 7335]|uniref:response regulator transcription factor n=1 Tax=Synechococcus sp. (strain ATCC 29403 / PCC 7335) TaxID=91464 RepID=UPI00017EB914|nr:response regulator transcription factor [Synechococcus sp. PCC 7335]EDX83616.1 response regulator receiver domain protein [Synechococcus sp. PCC 7335]
MIILIVEDDPAQLRPLCIALSESGHLVDGVENAQEAQWLVSHKDYDLLILDWMLPVLSGVSLCQHYRTLGKIAPVMMLTAKDTTADKVVGLDAGADDYLVKPVDIPELLARVRALGRRSPQWHGDRLSLGDLYLNTSTLTLERQKSCIRLSSREFHLMEYLMRRSGQVITRDNIEQTLWIWGTEPESNAVTALIWRLRQRLNELGAKSWLKTVYGTGYRLQHPEEVP